MSTPPEMGGYHPAALQFLTQDQGGWEADTDTPVPLTAGLNLVSLLDVSPPPVNFIAPNADATLFTFTRAGLFALSGFVSFAGTGPVSITAVIHNKPGAPSIGVTSDLPWDWIIAPQAATQTGPHYSVSTSEVPLIVSFEAGAVIGLDAQVNTDPAPADLVCSASLLLKAMFLQ